MRPSLQLKDLDYSQMFTSGWKMRNAKRYYCELSAGLSRNHRFLVHHLTCLRLPEIAESAPYQPARSALSVIRALRLLSVR